MALADGEASGMAERVLARLLEARWIVAAAIVAILLLAAWPGGGWPLAVLLVVGLLLVAAFTPKANGRRGGERPAGSGETPLDGVAVADLAASVPDPLIVFDARGVLVHANPAAASVFSGLTPGIEAISSLASCRVRMCLTMARPRPVPFWARLVSTSTR